ncbi:VanZ family protein [candidate division KSB1 bacterium]|nr:VanZ family protein [candidate division KSB1 bacterium]
MRIFFFIILILFSFISLSAQEQYKSNPDSLKGHTPRFNNTDRWFARDKVHHFAASAFLTGFGYYTAKNELKFSSTSSKNFSIGFSISFGILKEIYDGTIKKSAPSYKDLAADIAGTGVGLLILTTK